MLFSKIRLTGFKSFVDPIEIPISRGLTGIVGPNGCGKSNLVEALRWVMGENSAKKMRGGEMDDVIFGGSGNRPARNLAEVCLVLDNSNRDAPGVFNTSEEIEVTRRIERGAGSIYRVNGSEMRARDVQILFADIASGAHSPALVSQGRIGSIITAKPTDRRALLEEAAGITGLHSRRHEAELRLKAAEANLLRLEDVVKALENQLQGLKKQARQASRYRNLSDHIRRAEALQLHHRWVAADAEREAADRSLVEAEARVAELTEVAAEATTAELTANEALPELREAAAIAAAALQRLKRAQEALAEEESRIAAACAEYERRLQETGADIEREERRGTDATIALERLQVEKTTIAREEAEADAALPAIAAELERGDRQLQASETALTSATQAAAQGEARAESLNRRMAEIEARLIRLRDRATDVANNLAEAQSQGEGEAARLETARAGLAGADAAVATLRAEDEAAGRGLTAAEDDEKLAREIAQRIEANLARLTAEAGTLDALLAEIPTGEKFEGAPILDSVSVASGYEKALAAALGDDLIAPRGNSGPRYWSGMPPQVAPAPLPAGAVPLSEFVRGAKELSRRLSQIGVVPDAETGQRLQMRLAAGQRLVTREGSVWRWDGYAVAAGGGLTAELRLEQRARRADLMGQIATVEAENAVAATTAQTARAALGRAADTARAVREALSTAFDAADAARRQAAEMEAAATARSARLAIIAEAEAQLIADRREIMAEADTTLTAIAELPDLDAAKAEVEQARAALEAARTQERAARIAQENLARGKALRARRLGEIPAELESWTSRLEDATTQIFALGERRTQIERELGKLAQRPVQIEAERSALAEHVRAAEAKLRDATDSLALAETKHIECGKTRRKAETALGEARETRIRSEGRLAQARDAVKAVVERAAERLECAPNAALAIAGLKPDDEIPEAAKIEERLQRLVRERDTMGPVNLRAEQEAEELDQRITGLKNERDDLVNAIGRLRQGIQALNREGRERLLTAFDKVNKHFETLFVRLFGGGRAHLALTGSEDPLEAGLEIMASPPGKRLQTLSLLSGGEQALTALALLFAVFQTNPAPICVLDEVDAPLDDANVDRFCDLLEEMVRSSETRFLIITHHRLTMARMHRLYGVTMAERGVSQLVSVDLEGAERLRGTAVAA
jgi:chromosome segregation protein